MENERILYNVYIRIDENGCIIDINSDAFLYPTSLWVKIDSGYDDRCHYAESGYFDKSIRDERGIWRYKLVDGKPVERTKEEMDADYASRPAPPPSDKERIAQLEEELKAAKILLGLEV